MEYDATQPLPDSDLVMDEFDVTNSEEATQDVIEVEAKVKTPRRQWSHNADFSVITMTESGNPVNFYPSELPAVAISYLTFIGLSTYLSRTDDVVRPMKRLQAGERLGERGKPGSDRAPKPVDMWRQAIALALVDATKKAPAGQMTHEVATSRAVAMDKDKVKAMKLDGAVVKHFNKLSGGTIGYSVAAVLAEEAATV